MRNCIVTDDFNAKTGGLFTAIQEISVDYIIDDTSVNFKYWYNSEKADKIKERILSKNDVKIVYEFPWFWNIYFNKK